MRLLIILLGPVLAITLTDCGSFGLSDVLGSADTSAMPPIIAIGLGQSVASAKRVDKNVRANAPTPDEAGTAKSSSDPVELAKAVKQPKSVPQTPQQPKSSPSLPPAKPIEVGDAAFTVESVRCEGIAGVWATVLEGTVAAIDGDTIRLQLRQRLGLGYHPTDKGIDETDWYCVPKRKYCYASIGFSDWGGRYQQGMADSFARDQSFRKDTRLIVGITPILKARCP